MRYGILIFAKAQSIPLEVFVIFSAQGKHRYYRSSLCTAPHYKPLCSDRLPVKWLLVCRHGEKNVYEF